MSGAGGGGGPEEFGNMTSNELSYELLAQVDVPRESEHSSVASSPQSSQDSVGMNSQPFGNTPSFEQPKGPSSPSVLGFVNPHMPPPRGDWKKAAKKELHPSSSDDDTGGLPGGGGVPGGGHGALRKHALVFSNRTVRKDPPQTGPHGNHSNSC